MSGFASYQNCAVYQGTLSLYLLVLSQLAFHNRDRFIKSSEMITIGPNKMLLLVDNANKTLVL